MAVSRNRADYDKRTQMLVRAYAKLAYDGDEDKAWEDFFAELEKPNPSREKFRQEVAAGTWKPSQRSYIQVKVPPRQ